jgi:uncharacterized protein YjiS (DUF1127 family)
MATERLRLASLATPSLGAIAERLKLWAALYRERRTLNELDAHARADLGLTEGIAAREAMRPFWDVPVIR